MSPSNYPVYSNFSRDSEKERRRGMKKLLSKLKVFAVAALLVAIGAFAAGCGGKENPKTQETLNAQETIKAAFPVAITDVYGSQVTIDKEPERIVALSPSTVEVLYKLGLQDRIVGVTEYSDYPEEAKSKPKVGDFNGVNIEKIIEAKPDVVFAGSGMSKETFQKLTSMNIKILVTEARTVAQIPETFNMIGKATGTEDKAKALADEVESRINAIKDKVKDAKKVKTYYVISFGKDGNWTAGKGTFISDLIAMAGGENISDDVESWTDYSLEKIVEKSPELILISAMVANGNKDILNNENGYKDTPAVKNGNVAILDDNLTQRPGPRIVEGLEAIARAIHPEVFEK